MELHINKPDEQAMRQAKKRLDNIAKPLNSLGRLEELIIKCAGIYRTDRFNFDKKCVVAMCADNGVVEEGVTQVDSCVTAAVTCSMAHGGSTVCVMARSLGAEVFPVDIGVRCDLDCEGVLPRKLMYGTENIAKGPAMDRKTAESAIGIGMDMVASVKRRGYKLIATGEMGIGNTTTSAAVASVLLGLLPETITGRGAGLSDAGLIRKIEVIKRAISLNRPDPEDPVDVLSKVGGLDIAGMAGLFLGGAVHGVPVLIDGLISSVAALIAVRLEPAVRDYIFATHVSREPASLHILKELSLKPFLDCDMCLGEGTGAVAAFPLFDLALEIYRKMSTFSDMDIEAYVPQ